MKTRIAAVLFWIPLAALGAAPSKPEVVPVQSPYYSSHPTTVTAPRQPVQVQPDTTPLYPGDGVRIPLSNEEQKYYQKSAPLTGTGNPYFELLGKAWPVTQSHSFWALFLIGIFWLGALILLIRKMAKSGPRKPPQE